MSKYDRRLCEGCNSNSFSINVNREICICNTLPIKDNKTCPCSICIVKSMCQNVCEEFKRHVYSER